MRILRLLFFEFCSLTALELEGTGMIIKEDKSTTVCHNGWLFERDVKDFTLHPYIVVTPRFSTSQVRERLDSISLPPRSFLIVAKVPQISSVIDLHILLYVSCYLRCYFEYKIT